MTETHDCAWIGQVTPSPEAVAAAMDEGLRAIQFRATPGERWAIKLNLTYPEYLAGAVNHPAFLEGLCRWARDCRIELIFLEGDGGNGAYSAEDTFLGNGVTAIASRYSMRCVSISEKPWSWRETEVGGETVRLPYSPFFERREYDRFLTAPLFKNHIFTGVSLGMKNLWGCIPDPYRMYYHHILDTGIVALSKQLRPDASIFDGLVGMCGPGPIEGRPLRMNSVMLSNTVGGGEVAALEIMGIPIRKVRHLRLAQAEGLLPATNQVEWRSDSTPFRRTEFKIERSWLNHLSVWVGSSPRLQKAIYHSAFSPVIYRAVNLVRGNSAQARLYQAKQDRRYRVAGLESR